MKHFVHFDMNTYTEKPINSHIIGRIQNYVLKQAKPSLVTLRETVKRATSGYTLIASKLNEVREVEATSLILIDIDDEQGITRLDDFIGLFKGRLGAYYHSFSHVEGVNNRLRLIFQLEAAVSPVLHSHIAGELIKEIKAYYNAKNIDITGIIDETASKGSKRLWFGTNKGGAILDESARIGVLAINYYKNDYRKAKESEVRLKRRKRIDAVDGYVSSSSSDIKFEELEAMAKAIGAISSGQEVDWIDGRTVSANEAWSNLLYSIRSHEHDGYISESEAFALAEMVSGDGLSDKEFNAIKPHGAITIGTFIKYAIQRGYHFNNSFKEDMDTYSLPTDKKHTVNAVRHENGKEYVSKDFMKELLQKPTRTLVDSPTGSGKSYATVEAMKELSKENRSLVYVIASPTRALATQISKEREIPLIIGGTNSSFMISQLWQRGERVFSSTYDQAQKIIESIPANDLILVVDEVHKLTTDRDFRNDTVQQVIDTAAKARTFIGITGTSTDVYELMFDEKYTVRVSDKKIPASSFHVLQYTTAVPDENGKNKTDKRMELLPIVHLIKSEYRKRGIRSLVFLNNKNLIEMVAAELEKDGMNVFRVYRQEGEDSRAYEKVVMNDIDNDVDVILATKIIADGISLTFQSINWNIIVLSDNRTRTFNDSEVRQMFHRIRSPYRNAILITRLPNRQAKVNEKAVRFHKNRYMNVLHRRAKAIKQYYDDLAIEVTEDDFYKLEKAYGLYAKDGESCIDLNVLNAESVREKERYYSRIENRDIFISEVAKGIGFRNNYTKNVFSYELLGDKLDELLNGLETEEEKPSAEVLKARFMEFYTPSIHAALHNGNIESVLGENKRLLKEYREQYGEARINAMVNVARTVKSYEKAKEILIAITRRNETHSFMERLQVRNTHHAWYRRKQSKRSKAYTQKLYDKIKKEVANRVYTSSELAAVKKELAKKHKLSVKDITSILKLFTTVEEKQSRLMLYEFFEYDTNIEAKIYNMDPTEFNAAAVSILELDDLKVFASEIGL